MEEICFVNGSFVSKKEVSVPINDFGFSRGCALFEHFKTYDQKPFHSLDHLKRLEHGAAFFGIDLPYTNAEIEKIIELLHTKNHFLEAGYKIYLTAGPCQDNFEDFGEKPSFYVIPYPIKSRPVFSSEGIYVKTTQFPRSFNSYKTTFYLPGIKAQIDAIKEAKQKSSTPPVEVLYLDEKNHLLEGTFSSLLCFDQDTLLVPQESSLPSITQEVLLRLASPHFPIKHTKISYESLANISEVLFASSVSEIRAITRIDEKTFPVGKNTLFLKRLFDEYIEKGSWPLLEKFSYSSPAISVL